MLERFPEARERWQKAFRYVLVDEYQDTNHAQYRLLQLLAEKHRNVCAVGDPDQSIYAFRGADIRNILEFERDFGETRTVALEQNYRSTNAILGPRTPSSRTTASASRRGSGRSSARASRCGWSRSRTSTRRRASSRRDRRARRGGLLGDEIAVFYRTNAQSRVLEDVLVRQGIAYQVIGGPRFYERAEIKDAIAYLQVIDNPDDAVSLSGSPTGRGAASATRRSPGCRRTPTRRASRSGRRSAAPRPGRGRRRRAVQAFPR